MKREICAVVTKGTLIEGEMLSANPDASYIMALTENCQNLGSQNVERIFGVCVVDVATSRVILGQVGHVCVFYLYMCMYVRVYLCMFLFKSFIH